MTSIPNTALKALCIDPRVEGVFPGLCYNWVDGEEGIMLRRFRVILEPNDLGGYTVTVPILPGCISEGDTREEALANIKEAIELYMESLQADGEPIPAEEAIEEAVVEVAA